MAPYLTAGLGLYSLQLLNEALSPYPVTPGVYGALGFDLNLGLPVRPFLEVRGLFHVNNTGAFEYEPTRYLVASGGVQFEW